MGSPVASGRDSVGRDGLVLTVSRPSETVPTNLEIVIGQAMMAEFDWNAQIREGSGSVG